MREIGADQQLGKLGEIQGENLYSMGEKSFRSRGEKPGCDWAEGVRLLIRTDDSDTNCISDQPGRIVDSKRLHEFSPM